MTTPTNAQIMKELKQLQQDFQEKGTTIQQIVGDVATLQTAVNGLKQRMNSYEQNLKNNAETLAAIKSATDFIRKSIKVGRWLVLAVAAGFLGQFGLYLYHLVFH